LDTRKKNNHLIIFTIFIILFCTYIFPTGLIDPSYTYSKFIFVLSICFCYLLSLKQMRIWELIYMIIIILLSIISKNINYMVFITIPYLDKLLKKKDVIKDYILSSKILYVCLIFTIIYSFVFAGTNGRYAFTAIKEINQSGLAIFCLGLMLMKKNKKIGIFTLLLGLLTFSRSYYLAIIICLISKLKTVRKVLLKEKIVKFCNYTNLTIISSVVLIIIGFFYIEQYKNGNIFWGDQLSNRLYTFLDYSNFFRFTAIVNLILIFKYMPSKLLFGISEHEFVFFGSGIADKLGIPYSAIVPHNLFYSHLKIYGIFSFVETIYVSIILKKVVNQYNFLIFIAIVLYSFILGAGLYSYWLYLSCFVLIMNGGNQNENINN